MTNDMTFGTDGEMYADGLIQNRNAYVIVRNNT